MKNSAEIATSIIQKMVPGFKPKIGLILGSGLRPLADQIQNARAIDFEEIPGFPKLTVAGHSGQLSLGTLYGVPVACMQGRPHWYEGYSLVNKDLPRELLTTPVRTLKLLGCEILIITNAAGSLRPEVTPGNLVLVNDHINFQFNNPLVGPNDNEFGPRFVSMEDAYDPALRKQFLELAKKLNISLTEGVYLGVLGPSFETPAEIRAFRILGADVVGMSTIPEVILARHCGLHVVTISVITNMAAGLGAEKITHEVTLAGAKKGINQLISLISGFLESYYAANK